MPPLSLALAARPAALFACSRPPAARFAAPQARRRTWGACWRRAATSSGGCDDEEQDGSSSADSSSKQPQDSPDSTGGFSSSRSSSSSGGSGGGSSADADDSTLAQAVPIRRGRRVPVPLGLEAQLAQLAQQYGCSKAALSSAVAAMGKSCQAWFAEHSCDVAAWLHSQGITQAQLRQLLLRCPLLFTWPVGERAGVLFGQLQQLGLTTAEAARCFEQQPAAAKTPSFAAAIAVLVQLFAAGSKSTASAEQLVGSLLQEQPAAVNVLKVGSKVLQGRIDNLLGLGLSKAELVAALKRDFPLLSRTPEHLEALKVALQQELGAGRKLFAKLLCFAPRAMSCSEGTFRARAQALVKEFGQNKVQTMVGKAPILFAVDISVWQTALTVMALCGLTRQAVLKAAHSNANVLRFNWLAAERLVNRLALQRCLPGGLSAGQVYERHAGYLAGTSAEKLAGRLLFLQHHGLLHLLVEKKGPARRQWRRQRGLPANRRAPGEPPLISLHDVSRPDARFASLPVVDEAGGLPALRAFQRGLKSSSAWLELQAAAEAEQVRLLPLLPEHLRQAALGGMAVAVEQEEEEEEAFEDIPEEYEDPLLGGVMRDPVRLPSGNVVERSSIAQQLLTDPRDPYSRQRCTEDDLVPLPELKARIEAWVAEQRGKRMQS